MFVLEELTQRFSRSYLVISLSSAIAADIVTTYFFGLKPVLQIHYARSLPLKYYGLLLLLGFWGWLPIFYLACWQLVSLFHAAPLATTIPHAHHARVYADDWTHYALPIGRKQ